MLVPDGDVRGFVAGSAEHITGIISARNTYSASGRRTDETDYLLPAGEERDALGDTEDDYIASLLLRLETAQQVAREAVEQRNRLILENQSITTTNYVLRLSTIIGWAFFAFLAVALLFIFKGNLS